MIHYNSRNLIIYKIEGEGRSESYPDVARDIDVLKNKGDTRYSRYPLTYDHRMFDDLAPKGFGFDESFHVHV